MSKIRCELYKKENRSHKKKTAETIRMNDWKRKNRKTQKDRETFFFKKQTKRETEQGHPEDKQGGSRAPDFC